MTFHQYANFLLITCILLATKTAANEVVSYGRDVRPILADKCFFCHGPDPETREEGLRLDIRKDAIKGKAFIPGEPDNSSLIKLINSDDENKIMPPPRSHKKLTKKEKKVLYNWIKAGAEYEPHWAYQLPKQSKKASIDSLVLKNIKRKGLKLSKPAKPSTLLRRLHFDITGLPPTAKEVVDFTTTFKKDAQKAVIMTADKLLASPHFGERMAVKWLDAVRYADTVGYHGDQFSEVSLFRDYVIKSFNSDMPYDQFIIEQIAGDLIPNRTLAQQIASSYNRLGQMSQEGGIQDKEYIAKYRAERVRTTSATFLGSTMGCAECHDHKFDPTTAKDFYSFGAYFSDILEKGAWTNDGKYQDKVKNYITSDYITNVSSRQRYGPYLKILVPEVIEEVKQIQAQLRLAKKMHLKEYIVLETEFKSWLVDLRRKFAAKNVKKNRRLRRLPSVIKTLVKKAASEKDLKSKNILLDYYLKTTASKTQHQKNFRELSKKLIEVSKKHLTIPATISAKRRTVRLLPRGDWTDESGPIVEPAPPEFLTNGKKIGKTRMDLAKWIASEENPLTSRVFVNRVWSQFFGSGLSNTIGDFGLQGEYPSNPELLDWLAVEFTKNKWSVKQLIRTIVSSKTYQQTSAPGINFIKRDPKNRLLARQTQLRLPAELIRDNALAVSGLLSREIGGKSVRPYQPAGYYRHLNFPKRVYQASKGSQQYRRGIYTHWQRTFLHPMLKNFGAPARDECATERPDANTPLQALTLLNDPTFTEAARALATNLLRVGEDDLIQRAMMTCLSRKATQMELEILNKLHQSELKRFTADPVKATKFVTIGASAPPATEKISHTKLAAATSVMRTILNLHETITRY